MHIRQNIETPKGLSSKFNFKPNNNIFNFLSTYTALTEVLHQLSP